MRGLPYTPCWFIIHEDDGSPDTFATWRLGGLPKSDVECAALVFGMMSTAGARLRYGEQTGRWYMWDGSGRYAPQPPTFPIEMTLWTASALRTAIDTVWTAIREQSTMIAAAQRAAWLKQAQDGWKPHRAFTARLWTDAGQKALRNVLADRCVTDADAMDAATGRIIVDNGVIDYAQVARDGYVRLLPHDPDDLVTRRCGPGVRWEPDARCPAFERFMRESVPDDEQREWLLWRACNALFGRMPRKGFVNAIGERDSGKSTFTDTMARLAGDYARTVPVETFLAKHASDSGFRQHDLMGARFVYTHEPNPGALYDVSFMKHLTGRDRMRTAGKWEKPVSWTPQCTPFIGSNGPIRFSTSDDAMMHRQEAILFARGYAVQDDHLAERLAAELPGILRLLVSHAEREHREGVPQLPFSIVQLREQMAVATEDALEFIAEWVAGGRLFEAHGDFPAYRCAQVGPLYRWYKDWCEEAGVRAVGRKTFSAVVGRKYPTSESGGKYRFTGLVLPA